MVEKTENNPVEEGAGATSKYAGMSAGQIKKAKAKEKADKLKADQEAGAGEGGIQAEEETSATAKPGAKGKKGKKGKAGPGGAMGAKIAE